MRVAAGTMTLAFALLALVPSAEAIKLICGPYSISVGPSPMQTKPWKPTAPSPKRPYALFFDGGGTTNLEDGTASDSVARAPSPKMQEAQPVTFDELLDTPLIDPFSPSSNPWMAKFKELVREDYTAAEAIWAGVYCSFCVSVGMALVRAYVQEPIVESCVNVY